MNSSAPAPDEVRALLTVAFPGLRPRRVRRLAEGWDNTAFLVDEELLFRLPRHALGDRLLTREIALLAAIGARLPLPVPDYRYVADPTGGFPWHLGGYPLIPGRPLDAGLADDLDALARPLSDFLTALHALPETLLPPGLPRYTPLTWLERHDRLVATALPAVERADAALAHRAGAWWAAYRRDPAATAFTPAPVHGDLAIEHILVDGSGRPSGVIDFGDATLADPALDLAGLPDPLFAAVARLLSSSDNGTRRRRAVYRRLAPLHAINASERLARPELLCSGLNALRRGFDG